MGGQGRSGDFGAYEAPFVGSSRYAVGDYLGKDTTVEVAPCDHAQKLVEAFCSEVEHLQSEGRGGCVREWGRRALVTYTVMAAIYESAMRDGAEVRIESSKGNAAKYIVGGKEFDDLPTKKWS